MAPSTLALHEEVMLLALHDTKGTVTEGMATYGLAGALLAELVLAGRVELVRDGRKRFVELRDAARMDDGLLEEALERVRTAKRRASASTWVGRFAGIRKLKVRTAHALARRGILREREDQILLLFRRTVWPTLDPGPERALIDRVRAAILQPGSEVAPRTAVLIGLLDAARMMGTVLEKAERKASRSRIREIVAGEAVGAATKAAVEAVEAALIATTAATTAAITAATS